MKISIGTIEGKPFRIDAGTLTDTRGIICASSGSGKSYLLRGVAEQVLDKVQTIIIDPEGEYATLREKFDILIVGEGGDIQVDIKSAGLLARKLAETGVSAVLDIYDLPGEGDPWDKRRLFVYNFLRGLMNIPKELYHPMLIVVDEAHNFAMEGGASSEGKRITEKYFKDKSESPSSLSLSAMRNLMSAGRKRGFGGLLATQRISKIDKDTIADARNVFIGGTTLDIDQKRSGDMLGMSSRESASILRQMDAGEFFCFGPATDSREIFRFRSNRVQTTHPKAGLRSNKVVPSASAQLARIAEQFGDLPSEVVSQENETKNLMAEVARLSRELKSRPVQMKAETKIETVEVIKPVFNEGEIEKFSQVAAKLADVVYMQLLEAVNAVSTVNSQITASLSAAKMIAQNKQHVPVAPLRTFTPQAKYEVASTSDSGALTGPESKILNAIAWFQSIGQDAPKQVGVAFLAGYTYGGGAFNNPRGSLRSKGLVEYRGDSISLTEEGKRVATSPTMPLSVDELQNHVMSILPGPEQKILSVLLGYYPTPVEKAALAEASGYKQGGAFNNPLGRLRTLGLIDYPKAGYAVANPVLFLEA